MVARLENWPLLLSNYLRSRKDMPFAWGSNDCMAFAAYGIEAITGEQLFGDYAGYTTEAEADALLQANDGVEGILTAVMGQPSGIIKMAKRGDIVLINAPSPTAGIVDDSGQRVALVTKNGLVRHPLVKASKFWGY